MSLEQDVVALCRAARAAAPAIARATTAEKNAALLAGAAALRARTGELVAANAGDVEAARAAGTAAAFLDRLTLTPARVDAMAVGLEQIAALPDPVGEEIARWRRPNGLDIRQVRVPLGVIGIIYESRPNVTADAAGLCLKSGNAVVLRGGSEAFRTNCLIADVLRDAAATIPRDAIALVRSTDRAAVQILLKQDDLIDVIIPRGGEELIRAITEGSRIPVIQHLNGVCQLYVDAKADLALAEKLVMNAKTQRPGVCNAIENLLVHRDAAAAFLPAIARQLVAAGVELRGCPETVRLVPGTRSATEADWSTEYLDLVLAVRVVGSIAEAMEFIRRYGSGLAEAIVTTDPAAADRFTAEVDSAAVFVNASTRFTDGFEFGFGAEIGISTNRLHARGPMGLRELTTYKYVVHGSGQIRT
ncbi:MAG: glutamate-5-semialdehyde dehydrogenase [Polyangiaceae bacterium UTPRO1]|nr:glutamate-5-semialdehyde dehydrogenase [Myxococcales bacterium]OQY67185.1 MAG: glutamate-5-semialdehyde dehydrogenase [Polyangiaceae bacterium UTPRO1]